MNNKNFKIKNLIPFIIATTKAVLRYKSNSIYNLYIIKHLKEIKDLNKWKVIHGLYISIIKAWIYPKLICRLNTILNTPQSEFQQLEINSVFHKKNKETRITTSYWRTLKSSHLLQDLHKKTIDMQTNGTEPVINRSI